MAAILSRGDELTAAQLPVLCQVHTVWLWQWPGMDEWGSLACPASWCARLTRKNGWGRENTTGRGTDMPHSYMVNPLCDDLFGGNINTNKNIHYQSQYSRIWGRKRLVPVAQMVEQSAWIQRLWVQVPPIVDIFSLMFIRNTHISQLKNNAIACAQLASHILTLQTKLHQIIKTMAVDDLATGKIHFPIETSS